MSPVHPDDRPAWLPEPPRLPAWFIRLLPVKPGRPPRIRTPRYLIDFACAVIGATLLAVGTVNDRPSMWIAGAVFVVYALWLGLANIAGEQQITDWVNRPPDSRDVPEVERPNG